MAFFGLGAVFDTLTSTARTGTRENPTIASYKGGEFTRDQISEMTRNHYYTRNFLNELRALGVEKRGDEFINLVRPIQPIRDGQQEDIDEQVMGRHLMAKKAKAEGLTVSDSMVDQYLFGTYGVIDGDGLSNRDLELLNREVNNGQISMAGIRRHLKEELLNQQMVTLSYAGIPRVPNPLESAQFYAKMTKRMEGEIFPVSISDYVDSSAMPTQKEIRALYEEGKSEFKDPAGKRPGFKIPRRLKLQYFIADYEDFLDKATEGLTDQEIQAKYDELVEQESDLVMEIVIDEGINDLQGDADNDMPAINLEGDDGQDADSAGDDEDDAAPVPQGSSSSNSESEGDSANEGDQSYNVRSSDSKFVLVSMPAQDDQPATETPAADSVGDAVRDVVEEVADEVKETVEQTVGDVAEAAEEVAEIADEAADEAVQAVTGEEDADAADADSQSEPVQSEPVQSEADQTQPAMADGESDAMTETSETALDSPADVSADSSTDSTAAMDKTKEESSDVGSIDAMTDVGPMLTDDEGIVKRAKPLADVADLIRRQLKGQEAGQAMSLALKTAESEIENYYTQRLQWEVNGKETNKPEPELPNFQEIADRNGLRLAETDLVDNEGLLKDELGGVYQIFNVGNRNITVPMADVIFDQFNELNAYSTKTTSNRFTGKSYVFWPIELADAKVPKLEECKDQIVGFWRQRNAVDAAQKAAEEIAAKVGPDKKLSEIDSAKTIQTGEFTWFQPRGRQAVLSTPIGVDSPSDAFMETAFSLDQGQAGVAVNGSGDTIFVIQSQTPKASMAEVGDDFLKNQLFRFQRLPADVGLVSDYYFRQKTLDWNQEYVDSMGFELAQ